MIGQLISNYGEIGALGVFVLMMAWYLKYQTKQQTKREEKHDEIQKEERLFNRNIITNELSGLHGDSLKNADLNNQTIILQKDLAKDLREHNGHSKKAWEKTISSLGIIADRLNGGSDAGMAVKKELELYKQRGIVDRREIDKGVEVNRRKNVG